MKYLKNEKEKEDIYMLCIVGSFTVIYIIYSDLLPDWIELNSPR